MDKLTHIFSATSRRALETANIVFAPAIKAGVRVAACIDLQDEIAASLLNEYSEKAALEDASADELNGRAQRVKRDLFDFGSLTLEQSMANIGSPDVNHCGDVEIAVVVHSGLLTALTGETGMLTNMIPPGC